MPSLSLAPLLLVLVGCASDAPPPPAPTGPDPAWPTVPAEATAPPGYTWTTLRHETVHARLLVPDDAAVTEVTEVDAGAARPVVRVAHQAVTAELTFNPHAAWLSPGVLRAPVGGAGSAVRQTPDNIAWQAELPDGGVRVSGYARGVQCVVELGPFDRGATEEAFTVCASLRPPALGEWGPAAAKPNGTAVPAGAWVEATRGELIGDSLLGPYAPRLYAGWYGLAHTNCPADYATLGTATAGEAEVAVTRVDSAGGPAHLRLGRATRDGVTFTSSARLVAPRGEGCCSVELFPFRTPPSDAEIAYLVRLCDTTGR
jgi:hypothetical protein